MFVHQRLISDQCSGLIKFKVVLVLFFDILLLIISEELIDGKSAHDQESHVHPGADMQEICVVLSYHLKLANDLGHKRDMLWQIWYIG